MPKKLENSFSTYTSMMRVTKNGRPYTKDLYDMFAAVLLQVTLTDHRVMFRTYPYTFTTDEAAQVMSSLVFIHLHRHPDPVDPTRQIATRTTTTFSMDAVTARGMMQHFLSARLIMSATDPTNWIVRDKGLWCPTLKGKYILEEFTDYTQVEMTHTLIAALNAPYMAPGSYGGSRVITLDRLTDNDDQITFSRPNMTATFKAMCASLPNDTLFLDEIGSVDKKNHLVGDFEHTFRGLHCVEWLCDRLTVADKEEAEMVAAEFVLFGWIALITDRSDKGLTAKDENMSFNQSKNAVYYVTDRGCSVAGWLKVKPSLEEVLIQHGDSSSGTSMDSSSDASSLNNNKSSVAPVRKVAINTGKPPPINKVAAAAVASEISAKYNNNVTITTATNDFYQVKNIPAVAAAAADNNVTSAEMQRHDSATVMVEQIGLPVVDSNSTAVPAGENSDIITPRTTTATLSPRPNSMSFTGSTNMSLTNPPPIPDANSQFTRLHQILETPLLRMYFRDFLRINYCVENINFWVDHHILLKNASKKTVLEQITECYCIYETYLGPVASADVNIDHTLHQDIRRYASSVFVIVSQVPVSNIPYFLITASTTTATKNHHKSSKLSSNRLLLMAPQVSVKQKVVTIRGTAPEKCLANLLKMFERVNDHVCCMMAEDSLPKFIKTTKYKELMEQKQKRETESDKESYDSDDYYDDSEEDDTVHLATALADQRLSIELPNSRVAYSVISS